MMLCWWLCISWCCWWCCVDSVLVMLFYFMMVFLCWSGSTPHDAKRGKRFKGSICCGGWKQILVVPWHFWKSILKVYVLLTNKPIDKAVRSQALQMTGKSVPWECIQTGHLPDILVTSRWDTTVEVPLWLPCFYHFLLTCFGGHDEAGSLAFEVLHGS